MNRPFLEEINRSTFEAPYFSKVIIPGRSKAHFHEDIEVVYIYKGETTLHVDRKSFLALPGDICLVLPNQVHYFTSTDFSTLYTFKIAWNNSSRHINFSKYYTDNPIIKSETDFNKTLLKHFDTAIEEYTLNRAYYNYILCSCSNMILTEIIRSDYLSSKHTSTDSKKSNHYEFVKLVNEFIDNNYSEQISSSDIATYLNYSKYYFMHLFKEMYGTTFSSYLTEYRLKKAAKSLLIPNKKIYIIASECGFTNIRSFYKAFKKHYGMTASEYIKENKIYNNI